MWEDSANHPRIFNNHWNVYNIAILQPLEYIGIYWSTLEFIGIYSVTGDYPTVGIYCILGCLFLVQSLIYIYIYQNIQIGKYVSDSYSNKMHPWDPIGMFQDYSF